jgi:hypothetical protein
MLKVGVKVVFDYDANPYIPAVQLRLLSEFSDCISTPFVSNEGGDGWTITNESGVETRVPAEEEGEPFDIKTGMFTAEWGGELPIRLESEEELLQFNAAPGIHAVTLMDTTEEIVPDVELEEGQEPPEVEVVPKSVPLDFTYVDCSSFLLKAGSLTGRTQTSNGVTVEITFTTEETLRTSDEVLPLEPLVLEVDSLSNFPRQSGENDTDRLNNCFVCGEIPFGKGQSRFIFARAQAPMPKPPKEAHVEGEVDVTTDPAAEAENEDELDVTTNIMADTRGLGGDDGEDSDDEASVEEVVVMGLQTCYLSGLASIDLTREGFTSTTFVVEVHHDELNKRAFHARNVAGYNTALRSGAGDEDTTEEAADALSKPDRFLVDAIRRAVLGSGLVRPHGAVRFRLEQLLRSSEDLLEEFARRRTSLTQTQADEEYERDGGAVVVREDMMVNVQLSKPSKPQKWSRPSDISLRSALRRVEAENQSRMDGTLAGSATGSSTMGATGGHRTKVYDPPRMEKFKENGTSMIMSGELRRKLAHPKETPLVSAEVNERARATLIAKDLGKEVDFGDLDDELVHRLKVTPFTRMVFAFKYDDDATLMAINETLNGVNAKALPNIQGTLRSYSLTDEEAEQSNNTELDLLTGFTIIDDDMRIVVIEGLAGPGLAMQQLFADIPRIKPNDNSLKILCNPEVLFPMRCYTDFGPDLKRIRVRDKLKRLARKPEIYNRYQVEEICFQGIDCVMALRRATDLKMTKDLNMYPSADSLYKLELLYGEAISRVDLDGTIIEEKRLRGLRQKNNNKAREDLVNVARRESKKTSPGETKDEGDMVFLASVTDSSMTNPRTLPTDSRNPEFEEHLASAADRVKDFLGEQRALRMAAWENALQRREKRDAKDEAYRRQILGPESAANGGKIYCYANQALNFKVLAFTELRERLAKFKSSSFTFSKDFISQTVCIVDEDQDKKNQEVANKKKMLTNKGFRYPLPKEPIDYIVHPQKPSQSRIDALQDPFVETSGGMPVDKKTAQQRIQEGGYKTQIQGGNDFGKLKWPQYSREFQLNRVGDKQKLPRGKMTTGVPQDQDPNYTRSVFVGGDDAAAEEEADRIAEKEAWKSKVVVEDTSFKVGGFMIRDVPLQCERSKDILKDPPQTKDLKYLRTRTGHDGRDFSTPNEMPFTIINVGEFKEGAANVLMRKTDKTKFIGTTSLPKEAGPDFVRFINMNERLPKSQRLVHKRSIPPQDRRTAKECVGPKWQSVQQGE